MRVAILSATTGWHTNELSGALIRRGHTPSVALYERLVASMGHADGRGSTLVSQPASLLDVDAVLARIIPHGSLEQIIYRVNALHWIEARGIPVMNSPRAIERSVDKFYTTALLEESGLRVPDTVVCEHPEEALAATRAMGDVIFKPLFGSMGRGCVRVNDPDTAFRVARAFEELRSVFYVQRTIDHGGRDIRAFVIGGRVFGAIERLAPASGWRTNVARGGIARAVDLPSEWQDIAVRAARAVGADYAGVDLLPSRDGALYVLEVNGIPGWQGLQEATGLHVADAIVEHLSALVLARAGSCGAGSRGMNPVGRTLLGSPGEPDKARPRGALSDTQ
jgi:RimK family alpha-L-glutamate ligase